MRKQWKRWQTLFWGGSKITADGDCSHEIKRCLLPGRKAVTNLAAAAAAAKSLHSCPTLCDPIDGSPPGSPVPEILQARTVEWVAISFSSDKPRQHIKKQRHYFANKHPSSQSYGFSRSHVWMLELDHEEGWVPENWCFWTVVLEKDSWESLRLKIDQTSQL